MEKDSRKIKKIKIKKRIKKRILQRSRVKSVPVKQKRSLVKRWLKMIFFLFIISFFIGGGLIFFWISSLKIPNIQEIQDIKIIQSTKIYDSSGKNLLYNIYGDETRTYVPLNKISKHLQNASIAIEDKDFYKHQGIKITSMLSAAYQNFTGTGRYKRGASTITQQVIKNTLLTREKTYTRKIKEIILAYKLEKLWSKDQILELYLNESPYGGTIYGVEEAARYYFDKKASEIDIAEAAYLAAMPQAPSRYSPYGKNRKLLDARKNTVLSMMLNQNMISPEEYKQARDEEVEFVFKTKKSNLKAPHFIMYVIKKLEEKYGKEKLKTEGYKVITSLNLEAQQNIQEKVKEIIFENKEKNKTGNAAVVAIESKTGKILAMIGSRDYFDEEIDGKFNVATAKRQPGSSFKPFVYLAAFEMGYTPETILWDVDTEFNVNCDPSLPREEAWKKKECYRPKNYDWNTDRPFKGAMAIKNALPESRNIPAVKALYLVGVENAIKTAKLLGIRSLNKPANFYGLNLVLGGGEVQLLNQTSAYGTLANEGIQVDPVAILEVRDANDKVIYEYQPEPRRVVDSIYVKNINKILATDALKYPTFGVNTDLYFNNRIASKTGTTNNNQDSWVVGYDAGNFAVGVWVGNNDNAPMRAPGKITYKIFREAVGEIMKDYPVVDFPEAPKLYDENTKPVLRGVVGGGATIKIDITNGGLAGPETPEEFIKEIVIPSYNSILHWVSKKDPRGPIPEVKDDAYDNWEYGVKKWVIDNSEEVQEKIKQTIDDLLSLSGGELAGATSGEELIQMQSGGLEFEIFSPGDGDLFERDEKVYIKIKSLDKDESVKRMKIYFNGELLATTNNNTFTFSLKNISVLKKENKLKISVTGEQGKRGMQEIILRIKE